MSKQSHFFQKLNLQSKVNLTHGGEKTKGKRKLRRPLDSKRQLHVVMRSSKAVGATSFLKSQNVLRVKSIIFKQASKFGVRIAGYANVGNHVHLNLRFSNRCGFQNFLRSACAMIARALTHARRGVGFGKFWDALAYSRIIGTSRELAILVKYIQANVIEAKWGRSARQNFLLKKRNWELAIFQV